jgi:hypothetical protein
MTDIGNRSILQFYNFKTRSKIGRHDLVVEYFQSDQFDIWATESTHSTSDF